MNNKNNTILYLVIGLIVGMLLMYLFKTYKIEKRESENKIVKTEYTESKKSKSSYREDKDYSSKSTSAIEDNGDISAKTEETYVINYVKENHKLPSFYITKADARRQGWNPSQGNLCDVLPGRAIGGDHFSNREGSLPKGDQYYEADVNYSCGNRQTDRIVFTKNGEVWLTHDHYRHFNKQ